MPECAAFLAEPHRYKIMYGGRNGVKSWSMARQLLINAVARPIRWLCCRETMITIADSVHALLQDQIKSMGMGAHFDVQKSAIYGINGSRFVYAGLRGLRRDPTSLKSFESFDGAWVEEAQRVSKDSWNVLIPTIRKEGSEIWGSFNPELEKDETYQRFVLHPPPGAVVRETSYRDNPWLSEEARADMEHMKETDPSEFDHIYEGMCRNTVEGAYFRPLQVIGHLSGLCHHGRQIPTSHPRDDQEPAPGPGDLRGMPLAKEIRRQPRTYLLLLP